MQESTFGVSMAIFAALLAINDLGGGKYGEDEIKLTNEKTSAYLWYQSKGIKETLAEGQRDMVKTLLRTGSVQREKIPGLEKLASDLDGDVTRYKKEKREILLGSSVVGKENWAQDVDGELGRVIGAKQMEEWIAILSRAGDRYDYGNLFLQLCLVMGAVGLLVKQDKMKRAFYWMLVGFGTIGTLFSAAAYRVALTVPL